MTKTKAGYVDGFVYVVPKKNIKAYKKVATMASKVWKKYGALDYKECLIEDAKPDKRMVFTFAKITKVKPSEIVGFSYITYKSRKHRDEVNAKVMKDPAMNDPKWTPESMPFDMNRMAVAGFKVIVSF